MNSKNDQHCATKEILTGCIILSILLTSTSGSFASEISDGVRFYQQAEELYNNRQYQDALLLYKKAISGHPRDGRIIIGEVIKPITTRYGRAISRVFEKDTLYVDYYPNKRIDAIEDRMREQIRLADPPILSLEWIGLRDPSRDQILNGGETVTIVANINNSGESDALDVTIYTTLAELDQLTFESNVAIGTVPRKSNQTIEIEIKVARNVSDKNNVITIVAKEKGGLNSNELDIAIATKSHRPAKLEFEQFSVHDRSADTIIELGEPVTVTTRVSNTGLGVAEAVLAHTELGENVYLGPESQDKHQLGDIFPGESKDFTFTFLTNGKFTNNQLIPVAVSATELLESGESTIRHDFILRVRVPKNKTVISIVPNIDDVPPLAGELTIDVDNNIPVTRTRKDNAIAVVIGNRNYQLPSVPLVKYALNDAQIIKKYLINIMGYRERNIIYLQDASSAKFNETFGSINNFAGKLFNYIKPKLSDVFIYYSGHGAPDLKNKSAYFVPVDVDPTYIATSGYSLELFYKNLTKLKAKSITVVLDTCFSGNSSGGPVIAGIRPASIELNIIRPQIDNTTIFASSRANEISTWYSAKRHGLFTYYFLKGLRGLADTNNNSFITSSELGAYLLSNVPYQARRQGHEQSPSLTQTKDFIIADFR